MYSTISLLPPEVKKQYKARSKMVVYSTFAGVLLVIFFFVLSFIFAYRYSLSTELDGIKSERTNIQKEIGSLQKYEKAYKEMAVLEGYISQASGTVPDWHGLFKNLGSTIPNGVWLVNVDTAVTENGRTIKLKGTADSHKSVANWLEILRNMKGLSNIRCVYSTESVQQNGSLVEYEITASLLPGQPYKPMLGGVYNP